MEEVDAEGQFIGLKRDNEDSSRTENSPTASFTTRDPLGLDCLASVQAPSYSYSLDDGLHNFVIPISNTNAPYVVQGHSFDLAPTVELAKAGEASVPSFSLIPVAAKSGSKSSRAQKSSRRPTSSHPQDQLSLDCEWEDCFAEAFEQLAPFLEHVSAHVDDVPIISTKVAAQSLDSNVAKELLDDGNKTFGCLWQGCEFETVSSGEMLRHLNFHAFHTQIKSNGLAILRETNMEPCQLSDDQRNILPQLPECDFQCQWTDCDKANEVFLEPIKFYWHVQWHSEESRGSKFALGKRPPSVNEVRACKWRGCNFKGATAYKLKDHLKSHSAEKQVACPTCGGLYSSRSTFLDHCERQLKVGKEKGLKCSYCQKVYPSERLLRDHMRSHINHYQCPLCSMTCTSASSLNRHITYRHSDERDFFCPFRDEDEGGCDFTAKTQGDVNKHVRSAHYGEDNFKCDQCSKGFKSKTTLKFHIEKVHDDVGPRYCCHLCKKRFRRGNYLTNHLSTLHNYKWPQGHKKFRFTVDENGLYHVQTMRFESFDLTTTVFENDES